MSRLCRGCVEGDVEAVSRVRPSLTYVEVSRLVSRVVSRVCVEVSRLQYIGVEVVSAGLHLLHFFCISSATGVCCPFLPCAWIWLWIGGGSGKQLHRQHRAAQGLHWRLDGAAPCAQLRKAAIVPLCVESSSRISWLSQAEHLGISSPHQ